ncbi:cell surface protein SprA [Porphyromonadaceae bacterium OttesenSCG-928-L07]|nr:cell surface protein SprA [Porphyromonadaceae bacterium OttesenSCG-928-L07]
MWKSWLLLLIITCLCSVFSSASAANDSIVDHASSRIREDVIHTPSRYPSNVRDSVVYDPVTKRYVVRTLVGGKYDFARPYSVPLNDYLDYQNRLSLFEYNRKKAREGDQYDFKGLVSQLQFLDNILNPIFGLADIKLSMQGSVELTLGVKINRVDNPTVPVDLRKTTTLDFDEKIQFNINGNIGDLVNIDWSYNTDATFDFENILKLDYTGKEDDIVKKIEAGNVSLPLPGTLISGGRDLWGFRTDLQFGKLSISSIFTQQKGESNVVQLDKGGQKQEYELSALAYEANKHFFLSKYFRDVYDAALANLPVVNSGVSINKVEVWVTNKNSDFKNARNIAAFVDLGERAANIYNTALFTSSGGSFPDNRTNNLYSMMTETYPDVRNINEITNIFSKPPFQNQFLSGRDYEKIENARLLDPSEYVLNEKLGYISLNQGLNSDEVLAVAFEYTYRGEIFSVGELTTEGPSAPNTLVVKMLKSTTQSPNIPTWDLMMKNVYNIGSYGLSADDFVMDVLYHNDKVGTKINYIPAGNIKDKILLSVLNLDKLNNQLDATPDGRFDYIEGVTVYSSKGRIVFPVLEPFGSYLRTKINNTADADNYVFEEIYTQTQSDAEKQSQKNKYYLKGSYKSSTSSEISLGSFNVAEGSVQVIANGVDLIENIDYIVDYAGGTVQIINQALLASGTPITVKSENRSMYGMQSKTLIGSHLNYQFNEKFNIGATIMHMSEKPLTHKVNIGDEPISNTIWGLNASYHTESGFLTNLVDKLPLINTKEKSSITIDGEFAHFLPGTSKGAGGNAYIDDFEGSKISIDMKSVTQWKLASTPHDSEFPEGSLSNDYSNGFNRAKMAWYVVDPLFYRMSTATPSHIRNDRKQRSNHFVREIRQTEIFPNRDLTVGDVNIIPALSLAYYPTEKGPYNYDMEPTSVSAGVDNEGKLNNPASRWGGVMRAVQTNDFEAANVQYIEMWLLDPFVYDDTHKGGEVYFDLGNVSEDILRDGRKSFENGLPTSEVITNVDTTKWGRVPSVQSIVNGFDNNSQSRRFQDIGLDGLSDDEERLFFKDYLDKVRAHYGENSAFYQQVYNDPSGDNYHYFRGTDFDAEELPILERYKRFNGTEGNSPTSEMSPESYSTAATSLPDVEDINGDNTLNETEAFYRYKLKLKPTEMEVGKNFISNITTATVELPDGTTEEVKWYQIKIPLNTADRASYGGISDMKSIRFMRIILKNFEDSVILRLASLDLVRDNWRKYEGVIDDQLVVNDRTVFDVSAVNLEENSTKTPVNYLMPPGIERVIDVTNPEYKELNEQAMLLKIQELDEGDARAVYKNVSYDMLRYKTMRMDVHAEALPQSTLNDEELTLFIRMGGDNVNNYYEYEIPLKLTPPGFYPDDEFGRLAVWPADNKVEFPLRLLQLLKQQRNTWYGGGNINYSDTYQMTVAELDNSVNPAMFNHVVKVKGRPSLGEIKTIMIGVRNPSTGASKGVRSAEVWVNELRLSDFDNEGGWAANLRVTTKLADLATLTFAGSRMTAGFGSIEQRASQISREDYSSIDFSANVALGKFFPDNWRVRIPMYYAYSRQVTLPEYDPFDSDIPLDVALDNAANKKARDSIKRNAEDYVMRKSLNFTNIGIESKSDKNRILDISNLSLTYSFNKEYARNVNTERDLRKDHRGLLSYIYNGMPTIVEPFKKSKSLGSPYLKWLKDFNFYYLPSMLSFTSDISRNYREVTSKNLDNPDLLIVPSVDKDFIWQRDYAFKFNFTRNLSLDFRASARARIDEPEGLVDKERDPDAYSHWKDSVWHNIMDGGRPVNYNHNVDINYKLPIDKLPGLDWTTAQALYSARYDWQGAPITNDSTNHGNVIRNANSMQASAGLNLTSLYSKSKVVRDMTRPARSKRGKTVTYSAGVRDIKKNKSFTLDHKLKTKDIKVKMTTPDGKQVRIGYEAVGNNKVKISSTETLETATVVVTGTENPDAGAFKAMTRFSVGLLTSIKNIRVTYSETNASTLPGFLPESRWLGQQSYNGHSAPGFNFLFGGQSERFGIRAAEKGWITTDTTLNSPYMMDNTRSITVTSLVEPVKKLRIDLRAEHTRSRSMSEYILYRDGEFEESNKTYSGSFSMSIIGLNAAFNKVGSNIEASAGVYRKFLNNRKEASEKLAKKHYGDSYKSYELQENGKPTGYYDGYGETAQDVLISSFNKAYGVGDYDGLLPKILAMRPNWRITYTGLTDISFMKNVFRSFNISHSYRCRYNIGSYSTNLKYEESDGFSTVRDIQENWLSKFGVNTVSISEELNPLINLDMTWINNLTTRFSIIRRRDVVLSLGNSQITENASNEFVIGAGYRFGSLPIFFKNKKLDNDINILCDFSVRKNNTIIRRISENSDQLTAGQKVVSLNISADYTFNNRFNLRLFYDRVVNTPYVSLSFPTYNTNFGVSVRFTLAQ